MRRLLVAATSPTIRRIVELTFSDTDVRVECAPDGSAALARLAGLAPDLVLADVALVEPSAYDLCRAIKAGERAVPVLLLSGSFDPFDRERARECGADGHLVKPFESHALRERVFSLLDAPPAPSALHAPAEAEEPREPEGDALPEPGTADDAATAPPAAWVDAVACEVVRRLSDAAVREIAAEVVPRLARELIRERIRELEAQDGE